jgi:hypothetical protein
VPSVALVTHMLPQRSKRTSCAPASTSTLTAAAPAEGSAKTLPEPMAAVYSRPAASKRRPCGRELTEAHVDMAPLAAATA